MQIFKTIGTLAISLATMLAANAANITIRSYDNTNVIVETSNYTSASPGKVTIENVTKTLHDVKVFKITNGAKSLLYKGDVSVNGNQSAEVVVFPYDMLLVKEVSTETVPSLALKAADAQDINTVITNLKGIRNEAARLDKYKECLKQYTFTTAQLAAIVSIFSFEEIKANAAIMSYDNIQDKTNFLRLYALLMNAPYDSQDSVIE